MPSSPVRKLALGQDHGFLLIIKLIVHEVQANKLEAVLTGFHRRHSIKPQPRENVGDDAWAYLINSENYALSFFRAEPITPLFSSLTSGSIQKARLEMHCMCHTFESTDDGEHVSNLSHAALKP
jgi:hypothetical protein